MLTKDAATARLTREVNHAEGKIGEALIAATALLHTAATARAHATDVAPGVGHAELLRINKSIGGLLTLRADMARVHSGLERTGIELGILDEEKPYTTGQLAQTAAA